MRFRAWLIGFAATGLLAAGAAAEPEPAATKTWLLTRLGSNELLLLQKLLFRNEATGKDVSVRNKKPGPVLVEVTPGPHYLRRVDTHYENLSAIRLPKPEVFLELEAGKVNYIGDVVTLMTSKRDLQLHWDFIPNAMTVIEALAAHSERIGDAPIVFVRAGMPSQPIQRDELPATASP
jgi:hypothetical protein